MRRSLETHARRSVVDGIKFLAKSNLPKARGALPGYPFDAELLALSRLYKKSRRLYGEIHGKFEATLVSGPRALSSASLVESIIEYTPLESELIWAATDQIEKKNPESLKALKRYSSSVFHEQNHRVLWTLLPPAPPRPGELRRYLNFAEALVITTDMALGDELGQVLGSFFHALGIVYDPGTRTKALGLSRRAYRNYLHACFYATYLYLEGFDRDLIFKVIEALYSNVGELRTRAVERALGLNLGFVMQTNLIWQKRHQKRVREVLGRDHSQEKAPPLILRDHPRENYQQYVLAENWFEKVGI